MLDTDDIDYETEHDSRKRQIAMQDPVHTIVLRDYVQAQVQSRLRIYCFRFVSRTDLSICRLAGDEDGAAAGGDGLQGDHHERGRGDEGRAAGVCGPVGARGPCRGSEGQGP